MSNSKKFQEVLDLLEQNKQKKTTDTLKANRVGEEEKYKASQPYLEALEKSRKAKELKAEADLKAEKAKAKPPTPQDDIQRFGEKREKFRNLAYKTFTVDNEDAEGNTTKELTTVDRKDNQLFKDQIVAYTDSLKLAGMAQKYGSTTPDIRAIDRNREAIEKERNELWKKLMSQEYPLVPGPDETYTKISDQEKDKVSMEQANNMLVQKYGKAIIPLLLELKNR